MPSGRPKCHGSLPIRPWSRRSPSLHKFSWDQWRDMPLPACNSGGKTVVFFALLTTMMVPFEVLIIPVFLLIRYFPLAGGNDIFGQGGTGLINTLGGVMFPNFVSVFSVFLFRQFYLSFPKEIEEAAIVDGCSRIGVYWRILIPNSKPVMGTMALFAFLWSWNDFLWPLVVVKGG